MTADAEVEKKAAAQAAAELVEDGMTVGLGTGSTVAYLLPALASRRLALRCVATSPRTDEIARGLGLHTQPFDGVDRFDIAIDGADEVAPSSWLVKGGGAAHTREKIVAAAADRFVVIVDSTKAVPAIRGPVPLELLEFGIAATIRRIGSTGPVVLRDVARSPDGGIIADYTGDVGDPAELAEFLSGTPGVVEHGLFPPQLVWTVLVGHRNSVERIDVQGGATA
jgi:ribose 5-phosphate isomerase A